MFASKLNTMTGRMDWEILDEAYDYQQELARAGFADMLHDYERNRLYYEGLKKVIGKLKSENKRVNVLDIGTGTGLLAMMAVRCGADTVTACEAFEPMIAVAKKCIAANGMADRIKIVPKRSTDVVVGVDMDQRANVLVTEVFDTELIGEGAIGTFTHALNHLLTDDCHVIPDNAIMYVQIVESESCLNWNWLNGLTRYGISVPKESQNLAGNSIFDVQLTQFKEFKPLSKPLEAFRFSFSGKKPLPYDQRQVLEVMAENSGTAHGIFMWWICHMDQENEIIMSCAPKFAHHSPANLQWRDHWMQAIYFPSQLVQLQKDERFYVECNHDEYSLWFDVSLTRNDEISTSNLGNTLISRTRLSQLNDNSLNDRFIQLLKKHEHEEKTLLIVNDDFSVLPVLAAAKTKFKKILAVEPNRLRERCLAKILEENNLDKRVGIITKSFHEFEPKDLTDRVDVIFTECAFNFASLPWDNFYFYYGLENLRGLLNGENSSWSVLPLSITFKAIAVSLENLDKIRSPVGVTEGIDIGEFDKIILEASKNSDGFMEPHPLWEYPSVPLSDPFEIFKLVVSSKQDVKVSKETETDIKLDGLLNGVAMWYEIDYGEFKLNTGLLEEPQANKNLVWHANYKQTVRILDNKYEIKSPSKLTCHVDFDVKNAKFDVDFKIKN